MFFAPQCAGRHGQWFTVADDALKACNMQPEVFSAVTRGYRSFGALPNDRLLPSDAAPERLRIRQISKYVVDPSRSRCSARSTGARQRQSIGSLHCHAMNPTRSARSGPIVRSRSKSIRAAPTRRRKPRRWRTASNSDILELYELSVQEPEAESDLIDRAWNEIRGRTPRTIREDFCGTAAVCADWVKRRPTNHAIEIGRASCRERVYVLV